MEKYILDEIDLGILRCLQHDARLTIKALANKLHRSTTPIHERLRRLERFGYIKSYVAHIDYNKVRGCLIAYVQVRLREHGMSKLMDFNLKMENLPEVQECYQTAGVFDFMLKIMVEDMQTYNSFLCALIASQEILEINSTIVIAQGKSFSASLL